MQIEAGKFYKDRMDRRVGPMKSAAGYFVAESHGQDMNPGHYDTQGRSCYYGNFEGRPNSRREFDIIAEWTDEPEVMEYRGVLTKDQMDEMINSHPRKVGEPLASPTRTITRREIVLGKYENVHVVAVGEDCVTVDLIGGVFGVVSLRRIIATLTQIAEVLEEGK